MKLYIVRHGDPDYSIDNLTPKGQREAKALAEYFKPIGLHRIFTSPCGRAIATAEYTAQAAGLPVTVEPWSGELTLQASKQGLMAWDVHAHLLGENRAVPEAIRPVLTEEEYAGMHREVARIRQESDRFLEKLGFVPAGGHYRITNPSKERIAFFCHGGMGLTWLSVLLHVPVTAMWSSFFLPTSSVTEILFDERVAGVATARCVVMGGTPHLTVAGLPPGNWGLKANCE